MAEPPSGEQFVIRAGSREATIVEVGGGLRTFSERGRDIIQPYAVDAMCNGAHGAPLIPWPNRLADGRYTFEGTEYQVALSEPEKQNAIHGLTRWLAWTPVEHTADRAVMGLRLHPSKGYPFGLDLSIDYHLRADGLTVTTIATNVGAQACPFGSGQHPYLSGGGARLDECELELDALTRIVCDPVRQLPVGCESVVDTPYDFRTLGGRPRRRIGDLAIDDPFTDLEFDNHGRAWVGLAAPDGHSVELWVDRTYPVLQLFTGDRLGLAVEPMTCPANAFATGDRLIRLEPGQSTTTRWGLRLATEMAGRSAFLS